ncbi:MAG TPA: GNAT family N-acetyltransferase [Mycobacteriales bacterium]|nr:GNAT family N-acetyltransferase [Mycobacteriales bacterium]
MSTAAGRSGITIEPVDARSDEARALVASYLAEIQKTFGYDTTRAVPVTDEDFDSPRGRFLVVRDEHGAPVGCGAVRMLDAGTAEVKRMWVSPTMRGRSAGRALLHALESAAVELGATTGVLDTNATLTSALALYRVNGWQEVPPYNDNPEATHWFRKQVT